MRSPAYRLHHVLHAQTDTLQRLRHELRRPPVLRHCGGIRTTSPGGTRTSPTGPSWPSCSNAAPSTASSSPTCWAPTTCTAAPTRPPSGTARRCRSTTRCCWFRRWPLVTEHLGFGVTAGTAYEHPYPFARRMSTLDHLTNGRVGWNVVTGYLPSAARNMGTRRPARARLSATTSPTNTSRCSTSCGRAPGRTTPSSATASRGVFTDPTKVHEIGHYGTHFTVPGIHLSEPSIAAHPGDLPGRRLPARHRLRREQRRGDLRRPHRRRRG